MFGEIFLPFLAEMSKVCLRSLWAYVYTHEGGLSFFFSSSVANYASLSGRQDPFFSFPIEREDLPPLVLFVLDSERLFSKKGVPFSLPLGPTFFF